MRYICLSLTNNSRKIIQFFILCLLLTLFVTQTHAGCREKRVWKDGGVVTTDRGFFSTWCPNQPDCDCADLGRGHNTCISDCDYCEAFGNIGAR